MKHSWFQRAASTKLFAFLQLCFVGSQLQHGLLILYDLAINTTQLLGVIAAQETVTVFFCPLIFTLPKSAFFFYRNLGKAPITLGRRARLASLLPTWALTVLLPRDSCWCSCLLGGTQMTEVAGLQGCCGILGKLRQFQRTGKWRILLDSVYGFLSIYLPEIYNFEQSSNSITFFIHLINLN